MRPIVPILICCLQSRSHLGHGSSRLRSTLYFHALAFFSFVLVCIPGSKSETLTKSGHSGATLMKRLYTEALAPFLAHTEPNGLFRERSSGLKERQNLHNFVLQIAVSGVRGSDKSRSVGTRDMNSCTEWTPLVSQLQYHLHTSTGRGVFRPSAPTLGKRGHTT